MWSAPDLLPADVVFLSGAGISVDAPTCGPIGHTLTRRAFDLCFAPGSLEELQHVYAVLTGDESRIPRLEAVLEIAVAVHGPDVLGALLSDLENASPNGLHRFFALHASAGGRHITANFDTLIEEAGRRSGLDPAQILHFHGTLGRGGYQDLGARLSRIENGFDPAIRQALRMSLFDKATRALIVVGYSGLDFFDMDRFIRDHAIDFVQSKLEVIWIQHDHTAAAGTITELPDRDAWPPMLRSLDKAGVSCTMVGARTFTVLNLLAARWAFPAIADRGRGIPRPSPRRHISAALSLEATRRLYLHFGMYASHQALVAANDLAVPPGDEAEIAWQQGDHRRARRAWDKVYAGSDRASRARRAERAAACLWDRGSYLRAYFGALRGMQLASTANDLDALELCLELRARVLVHMGRTPDLRWFATSRRRRRAATDIRRVIASREPRGLHRRTRIYDALALLENDPERSRTAATTPESPTVAMPASDALSQYESLSAWLDYQRGEQRHAVSAGLDTMTAAWLETYKARALVLGKIAAARTVTTLPGAARFYSPREAWKMLSRAPATRWHRFRLFVHYYLNRG